MPIARTNSCRTFERGKYETTVRPRSSPEGKISGLLMVVLPVVVNPYRANSECLRLHDKVKIHVS